MNHSYIIGYSIVHADNNDLCKILQSTWDHLDTEIILLYDGVNPGLYPKSDDVHVLTHDIELFEHHCNNTMIDYFMNNTEKDVLIVLHEDMLINGFSLFSDLDRLLTEKYNIGFIGGRDGFGWGYTDMWSSPFSKSNYVHQLKIGQYQKVPLLNFGPVVYLRSTVEEIGKLDAENYKYAYADQDYSLQASRYGLYNYVLGMDITHDKFGNLNKIPPWCLNEEGNQRIATDFANLRSKWGI